MKRSTLTIISATIIVIVAVILLIVFTSGNKGLRKYDSNLDQDVVTRPADVGDIEIALLESFPVQVTVTAFGTLPDGCTEISTITQERNDNSFAVVIETERPRDAVCTQVMREFEQPFALDVVGLPKGEYLVNVNGIQDRFSLDIDNLVDFDPGEK
jgi:inhibitor of cysteine peptidase